MILDTIAWLIIALFALAVLVVGEIEARKDVPKFALALSTTALLIWAIVRLSY